MKPPCSGKGKLHLGRSITTLARFPKTLLWMGVASATAIGCGWFGTPHSVRFNAYQNEREMARLPPMPTLSNGLNELRASWEIDDDANMDEYARAETRSQEVDGLWDRASATEIDGDLRTVRDLLRQYLERTAIARNFWFDPKDRQQRRNSAIDKLDAIGALERGSSVMRVRAYLNARRGHDAEKPNAEEIQRALEQVAGDPNLRDNVAYLNAAELYRQGDYAEAALAFGAVARRYARSEKQEAAVFMSGVALMKTSTTFGSDDEEESSHDNVANTPSEPKVVVDEPWHGAVAVFQKLMTKNPRGRFVNDARGWLAHLKLRSHDRAGALVEYYRLLGDQRDENARVEAAFSLQLVRGGETDEEMARVERALEGEPDAALAYAYHNLYNYAIDPGPAYPPYDDEEIRDHRGNIDYEAQRARHEEREKEWQNERASTGRKEMTRVLDFASRLIRRYPNLATGGGFALRAAQASLELGDNETAVKFARRAIQSGIGGDERAQALWTNGVAEYRLRHFEVARKQFTTLLRDYPTSRLVEGARRLQAMIAEDSGDIDSALEQYIALDYRLDAAYFVDVLMTTDQLAGFIQRHPDSPKTNELVYALGLRYLRADRWDDARQTFARVKIAGPPQYNIYAHHSNCEYGNVEPGCDDPKEPEYDAEEKPMIAARLVMRDVQTANDLEALERTASQADGPEARAEALYQLASYQFEASSLLFYNPVAWGGGRYWNLSQLAGEGRYRLPNEPQILWKYMQEHDRLARALKIYLEVANRFPKTRAARDALYTAAVCHERLSNSNPYWREAYQAGLHAGERMVTYDDVKAAYPRYQLPRGTYYWQPKTRTVNGGPGWSAPPKPLPTKPKPTRLARARKAFFEVLLEVKQFWDQTARRWTVVTILAMASILIYGISAAARTALRPHIGRLRLKEYEDTYPWMQLFQIEPVQLGRQKQARQFFRRVVQGGWELARDRQSRPALAANVVAHGFLTWSLVTLVQTLAG